jgi:para-aminobenzoate synthetase/4-amino-4-deoxychorismate lyase
LAELRVLPLAGELAAGDLLRAVHACPDLDSRQLLCLAGRWGGQRPDSGAVIAWNPSRIFLDGDPACLDDLPYVTGAQPDAIGGGWFGWLPFGGGPSWLGFFDTVLRQDKTGRWWLESVREDTDGADLARLAGVLTDAIGAIPAAKPVSIEGLTGTDRDAHLAAVEHVISAIRAGELYQVNVCARFSGRLVGEPLDLFSAGLTKLHPDYAAYLQTDVGTVVSFSPELFLQRHGRRVHSAPIKGTRRRTVPGDQLDDPAARELRNSAKDSAENVMIVDLMRNDLSRVCEPGTVTTPELLAIRPAPGVWHLVSEVAGTLRDGTGDAELIRATFPPGSVTGAPKIRALALIDELEQRDRCLFTGAIGYVSALDRAEFNVAIRTFEINGDRFELGVGGGITADSVPMQEWQECLIKAAPLLRVAGTALDPDASRWPEVIEISQGIFDALIAVDGQLRGLSDHLTRLESSSLEVFGRPLPADLGKRLLDAVRGLSGRHRVRVVVRAADAQPTVSVTAAGPPVERFQLISTAGRTGCWRHKWNDRSYLASFEDGSTLPLFVKGNLALETSRSNIAVLVEPGVFATPPLSDDVLAGITRRRFIDAASDRGWRVELRGVTVPELLGAGLVLSLNASGIVAVGSLDGQQLGLDQRLLDDIVSWGC